jgi:hypothetical protein
MTAFRGFIAAADLQVDPGSPGNMTPPFPDIGCKIGGAPYYFELGEITDEDLARDVNTSLKTGVDGEGGFFTEDEPLMRMIRKKASSTYQTNGAPVDLVLHYDKQAPFAPSAFLQGHEGDIDAAMTPNGPFSRVWVYDSWTKSILWKRP